MEEAELIGDVKDLRVLHLEGFLVPLNPDMEIELEYKGVKYKTPMGALCGELAEEERIKKQFRYASGTEARKLKSTIRLKQLSGYELTEIVLNVARNHIKRLDTRLMKNFTNGFELIFANMDHDNIFGKCKCEDCKSKGGANLYGKALTKALAELED